MIALTILLAHGAAHDTPTALITSTSKSDLNDLIGLSVSQRGEHMLLTQETDKDELFLVLVYSEDPQINQPVVLTEIAQKFLAGTRDTFCSTFKKIMNKYITNRINHGKSQLCNTELCIENLIAVYMQLTRAEEPLKKTYKIETVTLSYHDGGITSCDKSMIGYAPYDNNIPPLLLYPYQAQLIADKAQTKKPNFPFHLIIDCTKWKLPRDPSKAFKSSFWSQFTLYPQSDTIAYVSTGVHSETEYTEHTEHTKYREQADKAALEELKKLFNITKAE